MSLEYSSLHNAVPATGAVLDIEGDEGVLVPEPRRPPHRTPHQKDAGQHRHARLHQAVSLVRPNTEYTPYFIELSHGQAADVDLDTIQLLLLVESIAVHSHSCILRAISLHASRGTNRTYTTIYFLIIYYPVCLSSQSIVHIMYLYVYMIV